MLSEERNRRRDLDIKHLLAGHILSEGSSFSLSAETAQGQEKIMMEIEETYWAAKLAHLFYPSTNRDFENLPGFLLSIKTGHNPEEPLKTPLFVEYGLAISYVKKLLKGSKRSGSRTNFIPLLSLAREDMAELYDEVALKPEEAFEIKSPQAIEPSIERIASIGIV
jgi:hypothetical protein